MNRTSLRQSVLMSAGTVFNSLLGLLFYILVAKNLGVERFGHFSYLLGLGLLAAELGDLGVNSAIVKFGSGDQFSAIFSFALVQRAAIFILILAIFSFLGLFPSAAVAVGLLLAYLATQSLLARQKFGLQVFANVLGNCLRLILLFTTPLSALIIFFLGTLGTFLAGIAFVLREFQKFSLEKSFVKEILKFSLPAAGSFSLASLAAKIDVPILYALAGPVAVGLYSSAQKLTSVIPQITAALDGVFAPKYSRGEPGVFKNYLSLSFLSFLLCLVIPFSPFLIPAVFGPSYLAAVPLFNIFLLSFIPLFLAGPFLGDILYRRGKSVWVLAVASLNLALTLALYLVLIPRFGASGAAVSSLVVNVSSLLLYVCLKLRS